MPANSRSVVETQQRDIAVDNCDNSSEGTKYWIEALGLLMSDKGILQSHTSRLNRCISAVTIKTVFTSCRISKCGVCLYIVIYCSTDFYSNNS